MRMLPCLLRAVKLRSTAWAVVACAEYHRSPILLVENVPAFEKWVLFPAWKDALRRLGVPHDRNSRLYRWACGWWPREFAKRCAVVTAVWTALFGFAGLDACQVLLAPVGDAAQLIQSGVHAIGDHATLGGQCRWVGAQLRDDPAVHFAQGFQGRHHVAQSRMVGIQAGLPDGGHLFQSTRHL